jgi:metal-responsive CopG/Arc/MetJ family transcriptional regulator
MAISISLPASVLQTLVNLESTLGVSRSKVVQNALQEYARNQAHERLASAEADIAAGRVYEGSLSHLAAIID